ncbi:MAG: HAD family hydrolase [Ruthenibacterium sp.]
MQGQYRTKPYLICVDSDGCVMDSMESKHRKFFCPLLIETWDLQANAALVTDTWMEINLYRDTRGINRFAGFALLLQTIGNKLTLPCSAAPALQWIAQQKAPSHRQLEEDVRLHPTPALQRLYTWSCRVNNAIAQDDAPSHAFPGAAHCISTLAQQADILVVSSANRLALETEWRQENISKYTLALLGQDDGSKKQCIAAYKDAYAPEHVLMIGDAPGDFFAAQSNHILFYPIIAGREIQSWVQAQASLVHFFNGTYSGTFQNTQLSDFFHNLHSDMPTCKNKE